MYHLWQEIAARSCPRVFAIGSFELLAVQHWHPAVSLHIARHLKLRAELMPKS